MRYGWSEGGWRERPRDKGVLRPIPVVEPSKEYVDLIKVLRTLDEEVTRLLAGVP